QIILWFFLNLALGNLCKVPTFPGAWPLSKLSCLLLLAGGVMRWQTCNQGISTYEVWKSHDCDTNFFFCFGFGLNVK
ncbi:hypothetical protein BKA65DRAFT_504902, partial [Rhexocercosporidium sp. MPI-PUGE-AT-0058]